jgi:uncharacterized protein with GYD domain
MIKKGLLLVSLWTVLLVVGAAYAESLFDDSAMRKEIVQRIAKNHQVRINWQNASLLELMDAEARLDAVKRIKRKHGVKFDWRKSSLMSLMDIEARMDAAKRISKSIGKPVNWQEHSLLSLMEMETRLSGVDVDAIKKKAARRTALGQRYGPRAYRTRIESDHDDILKLENGGVVEITSGYLGYVGYRKHCVLFKSGTRWRVWIEGKKIYKCELLSAPDEEPEIVEELYISEVKGDGSILVMLDGSIYEVDSLDTITTGLWLGMSDALLFNNGELLNLDEDDEMVNVIRIR